MDDSILTSVKLALGIIPDFTNFDPQLIMHINSVFSILSQLGLGPEEGFEIEDGSAVWEDFIEHADKKLFNSVKTDMYLRVRLLFDPPSNSFAVEAMNKQISEIEWRLYTQANA